jgi:cbb3-type cytochrome c oxidase subunit III
LYVAGQAAAGEVVYNTYCVSCHGPDLQGGSGPTLVGSTFLLSWGFGPATRTLADLFFVVRTLMPQGRARDLSPEQHLNVLAHILQKNGYQPGDVPLTADEERLRAVALWPQPFTTLAAQAPRPDFLAGEGGLEPEATGLTQKELDDAGTNGRDWLFATHDHSGRRYPPGGWPPVRGGRVGASVAVLDQRAPRSAHGVRLLAAVTALAKAASEPLHRLPPSAGRR